MQNYAPSAQGRTAPRWDFGEAIAHDADGNVYVSGSSWVRCDDDGDDTGCSGGQVTLAKWNALGTRVWSVSYGSLEHTDYRVLDHWLAVDVAGCAYVTTAATITSSTASIMVVKFDPDGKPLWEARLGDGDERVFPALGQLRAMDRTNVREALASFRTSVHV